MPSILPELRDEGAEMSILKRLFGKRDDQVTITGHGYEFDSYRHWYILSCGHKVWSEGHAMQDPKACSVCGRQVKR